LVEQDRRPLDLLALVDSENFDPSPAVFQIASALLLLGPRHPKV
jgi:hypothetical protein